MEATNNALDIVTISEGDLIVFDFDKTGTS